MRLRGTAVCENSICVIDLHIFEDIPAALHLEAPPIAYWSHLSINRPPIESLPCIADELSGYDKVWESPDDHWCPEVSVELRTEQALAE